MGFLAWGPPVAEQAEFRLGVIGAIAGGRVACSACGYALPLEARRLCPLCGFERSPYPAGRVERFGWVFEQRLDPPAKLVLLALVAHDMPTGNGIFPSQTRLSSMTGLARRSVIRALARLREAGWIEWHKGRRRDGRQGSNSYTIQQPGMTPECQSVTLARVTQSHTKG